MKSRKIQQYINAAKLGAKLGIAGAKQFKRIRGNYTKVTDKPEADQRGNTTTATDTAITQYKKRKNSRRARKNKKSYKSFIKNAMKLVGSNVAVRNAQLGNFALTRDQEYYCLTLGGKSWSINGNQSTGSDDMRAVLGADDRLTKIANNTKALIQSARMDVTFRNAGTGAAEVDMYTIQHFGDKHVSSYIQEIGLAETRTPLPPQTGVVSGSDPTLATRGMTLFDFPILSKMGNQITEKKKFIVAAGGTITHSLYTKKNTWFDAQEITGVSPTNADHYVKSGFTKSLVFVVKPVIGVPFANLTPIIGNTNCYKYKIFSDNRDFNVYNPA